MIRSKRETMKQLKVHTHCLMTKACIRIADEKNDNSRREGWGIKQ